MNIEISLEDLLKNGSHFGHNKKRWNPKMEKYIYGEKNGTHILDLRKSLPLIESALKFAHESSKNKKFVKIDLKELSNKYIFIPKKTIFGFQGIKKDNLLLCSLEKKHDDIEVINYTKENFSCNLWEK